MTLIDGKTDPARTATAGSGAVTAFEVPVDAALVMSAMEAGRADQPTPERRANRRRPYRTAASLWLFSDPTGAPATTVYIRDISRRGVGFISNTPLPLGHGGIVELPAPDGTIQNLHCTLLRCRQAVNDWYEGTLHFNRDQPEFDVE